MPCQQLQNVPQGVRQFTKVPDPSRLQKRASKRMIHTAGLRKENQIQADQICHLSFRLVRGHWRPFHSGPDSPESFRPVIRTRNQRPQITGHVCI